MLLNQILDKIYKLPETSKFNFARYVEEVTCKKGYILCEAGKIERNIYLIQKGIVRAYAHTGDHEITFWFGKEGDPVVSMRSYVANQKGYEQIELLEDCHFYKIASQDLAELYARDIHLANWGRKFAELELIKTEEYLISRQFRTAAERYNELIIHNPELLKRVQLGHIASYLGISQVSLSRIRSKVKQVIF